MCQKDEHIQYSHTVKRGLIMIELLSYCNTPFIWQPTWDWTTAEKLNTCGVCLRAILVPPRTGLENAAIASVLYAFVLLVVVFDPLLFTSHVYLSPLPIISQNFQFYTFSVLAFFKSEVWTISAKMGS